MSVAPEEISKGIGLDISAGRRPPRSARRGQAKRASEQFWITPLRRLKALARVVKDSAIRSRPRVLDLDLPEYTVSFNGPAEFEFALSSRTEFPVRKLGPLMKRSADDLRIMASNIRQVEKRFAEVLAQSLHQPGLVSDLLRGIELKLFSQDHQWRDIAEALNHLSPAFDVYKRIALVKYLQYLGCRQDVLRNLYLVKLKAMDHSELSQARAADEAPPARQTAVPVQTAVQTPTPEQRAQPPTTPAVGDTQMVSMRDTAIFHVEQIHMEGDTEGYAFLPRGETVEVAVNAGEVIDIALSTYRLKLYPGQRFRLTDESGNIHILPTGKSIIGRHHSADIVVGGDNRTISRKHLLVEPVSSNNVKLTDLSSHGTSIPVEFVANAR